MKKKKSNKLNLIICAIAFVFMIFYVYFVDGFDNLVNSIRKINVGFLFIAVSLMIVYWLLEALGIHAALRTTYPKAKFSRTFMTALLGQYFNCITPSSTGGQPMQVYYFTKFGVPMSHAMTALLSKFIMYQFVLTGYSAVVLIARFKNFSTDYAPLMALVILGFIINTIVIILLFMLAFFKKPVKKLAVWAVKLLAKIHIFKFRFIKSEEEKIKKIKSVEDIVDEYHDNFVFIKKKTVAYHTTDYLQYNSADGLLLDLVYYLSRLWTVGYGLSYHYFVSGVRADDLGIYAFAGCARCGGGQLHTVLQQYIYRCGRNKVCRYLNVYMEISYILSADNCRTYIIHVCGKIHECRSSGQIYYRAYRRRAER